MDLEVTRDQDRARREARRHLRSWLLVCAVVVAPVCAPRESDSSYRTWSAYGGGPEQLRYASLNQINRDNVSQLEIAWIWDSRETGGLQTQPLVVDDLVFAYAPTHRTVAIDGATGQLSVRLWHCGAGAQPWPHVLGGRC